MLLAIGVDKKWNLYEKLYKEACETGEDLLKNLIKRDCWLVIKSALYSGLKSFSQENKPL